MTDPISTSHLGLGIIYYVDTYVHVGLTDPFPTSIFRTIVF